MSGQSEVIGSIPYWAEVSKQAGLNGLANGLSENPNVKLEGLSILKSLSLPHLEKVETNPKEFFKDPESVFLKLSCDKYYVNFISDKDRSAALGLDKEQLKKIIQERQTKEEPNITVIVSQYFENHYGGHITVNPQSGHILLELSKGNQLDLARGKSSPTIIVERDPLIGTFKYHQIVNGEKVNLVDEKLKKTLFETLDCIPKDTEIDSKKTRFNLNEQMDYHPGYYEFVLVNKEVGKKESGEVNLSPIFLDYRGGEVGDKYQLTSQAFPGLSK